MRFTPYRKSRIINSALCANSEKEANVRALQMEYAQNMVKSLEYEPNARINGVERRIIATKAKGTQRYEIQSYPGETFHAGDIVECFDSHWIVIEVTANKEIYTTGTMLRCNHKFRFQNGTSKVVERWGVLDTGVYSTTVKETDVQTMLNKQYKIYMPLDDETRMLYVGKRIATGVMKDSEYNDVLTVYRTTEFDDLSENYGEDKLLVLKCISDTYNPLVDSFEHQICDYIAPDGEGPSPSGLFARILYSGDPIIRIAGGGKTFEARLFDSDENAVEGGLVSWNIFNEGAFELVVMDDKKCRVIADNAKDRDTCTIVAEFTLDDKKAEASLVVEAME